MKYRLLLLVILRSSFVIAVAVEPPTSPILRIDAAMHTSPISHIATDDAGRLVLTCSSDKTARLWALGVNNPKAQVSESLGVTLLHTLRPPLGNGHEGKLRACALSPDGTLAAVGGTTGYEWNKAICIYLFSTSTGQIVRTLNWHQSADIEETVYDLAFSDQGQFLAAALGDRGLRVWQTVTGDELERDGHSICEYIDWHSENRIVTSGFTHLCLYQIVKNPIGKASTNALQYLTGSDAMHGKLPVSPRFSPDGDRIAIGYVNVASVSVLDGSDLSLLYSPATIGVNKGGIQHLSWTADGETLVGGGTFTDATGNYVIRSWARAGKGDPQDNVVSTSMIMDMRPLRSGRILYAARAPAWGVLDTSGHCIITQASPILRRSSIAEYNDLRANFLISSDGSDVAFRYDLRDKNFAMFSLANRQLSFHSGGAQPANLHPPRTEGLGITGWKDSIVPELPHRQLFLMSGTASHSLAITKDASSFILGCTCDLRSFDAKGHDRWNVPTSGLAWAVNISSNNQIAVAAFEDGTIRWYDWRNGRELLALFIHTDGKRWVLWTPQGFYDCSADGESLIGWHVNRGRDQAADFYPASKFRDQFYRPDVISRVLQSRNVAEAVKLADKELGRKPSVATTATIGELITKMQPPVVTLLSGGVAGGVELAQNVTTVSLRYRVRRGTGAEVRRVRLLMDGRPMEADLPIPLNDEQEMNGDVTLPQGHDCVLSLLAENQYAASVPVTLRIKRAAASVPNTSQPAILKPKLYLLTVGVSDYSDASGLRDLGLAAKDAQDLATAFKRQEGLLYQKVEARTLTDKDATATHIKDGLDWVRQQTTAKDVCAILLAGHGDNDNQGRYFFCPHDYDGSRKLSTTVSFEAIRETVSTLPGKVLFFIDTCHAGNALGKMAVTRDGSSGADINRIANELSSDENGAVVFSSSTGRQLSQEKGEWGNGAFTKAVVEGLNGEADLLKNGKITIATLEAYVAERVKTLTGGEQTPTVTKPQSIPDFTISVKK